MKIFKRKQVFMRDVIKLYENKEKIVEDCKKY